MMRTNRRRHCLRAQETHKREENEMTMRKGLWLAVTLVVSGCAGLPTGPASPVTGIDGVACVTGTAAIDPSLKTSENDVLLGKARGVSGKGGTCDGQVYAVSAPVKLYRVYDSAKGYTQRGSWWALEKPSGTRDSYRATYAICPEWSAVDALVECEIRPGTQVVIVSTQSAVCGDGTELPKTAALQVYVANDGRSDLYHVGACKELGSWP